MVTYNTGKVVIISVTDGFLAKSLMGKLEAEHIRAEFSRADIREIKSHIEEMELVVLFMSEELAAMPETLVYLKDLIQDKQPGVILIGEEDQYNAFTKLIPEESVTQWFKRPLDIDKLSKTIRDFISANSGENRRKTVLIVDDDITYMHTVYEWLRDHYRVGMAANGVQAISYLAKNKADLVLLDYEMPIVNGPQVYSMLKSESETGEIPVMFLTGHSDRESVMSAVDLKPVDYLLKTIDKPTLLKKLSDFFEKG